jgi:hypothetical protein
MKRTASLTAIALSILLPAALAEDQPTPRPAGATTRPATATTRPAEPAGRKYEVTHTYKVGERLLLHYTIVSSKRSAGNSTGNLRFAPKLPIGLVVEKGEKEGEKVVRMSIRRIVVDVRIGRIHRVVDSAKPKTLVQGMPLNALTNTPFTARLDGSGEIVSISGVEQLLKRTDLGPPEGEARKQFKADVEGGIRQLLEEPFAYLPPRAVGVGESWPLNRKTYDLPIMGAVKTHREELVCRLAEVKTTPAGRVAVVKIAGTATLLEGGAPGDPQVQAKTGTVAYNIDTGDLVSHHVHVGGEGTVTDGTGKKIRYAADTTVDATLREDTPKKPRPLRPATRRALPRREGAPTRRVPHIP